MAETTADWPVCVKKISHEVKKILPQTGDTESYNTELDEIPQQELVSS